jgi:hypothetical protein
MFTLVVLPGLAQPAAAPPSSDGRFLFLVDTSLSMQRRAEGVARVVEALFRSDLDGRLRPGDTIGLWTFNAEVYAGHFPLQTWSPAARRTVTDTVVQFLGRQQYGQRANLDKVFAKAVPLVRDSKTITLVLFTDGEERVRGTPFDAPINATLRELRSEQRRIRMPFVLVLRAQAGEFVNYAIGQPPWPVKIPLLPAEERALAAIPAPPPPQSPPAASVEVPPPSPSKPVEAKPSPMATEAAQAEAPAPEPEPASAVKAVVVEQPPTFSTAPEKPEAPARVPSVREAPPPTNLAKAEAPPVSTAKLDSPVPIAAQPGGQTGLGAPAPSASIADATPKTTTSTPPSSELSKQSETKPASSPKLEPSEAASFPAGASVTEVMPSPATPDTKLPPSKPELVVPVEPAAGIAKPAQEANPSAEVPLPVQAATALTPRPFLSGSRLLMLGLLLMAVAGVLFFFIVRRARAAAPHASLITQSFDRDKHEPGTGGDGARS